MADLNYAADNWLGETPDTWSVVPAKSLFSNPVERNHADDVHLTPSQKFGVLPQSDYMEMSGNRVVLNLSGADNMRHVEPGDFVSHLRSFQGGLEYSPYEGKVSSAYTVLRPKRQIEHRFYKYLFKSGRYVQGLSTTTEQLRDGQSIRYEQFALLRLPYPPLEEQKAIADYLDHELESIDKLFATQQRLKKLIEYRRASLILNGVLGKFLNIARSSIDDSDWIDSLPSEWQHGRLKYSISQIKGGVWGQEDDDSEDSIWCVRIADFDRKNLRVNDEKKTIRSVTRSERSGRILKPGDLLLEKSGGGDQAPVGCVVSYDHELQAVSSNFTNVLRLTKNQNSRYWTYVHQALYSNGRTWRSIKQTSGIQNLDTENYLNEIVPFPPEPDQNVIARYLDKELAKIDKLQSTIDGFMTLLQERRKALINSAVTGKIDVRGKN